MQHYDREVVFGVHAILELLKAKKRKLYTIYTTKPFPKAWSQIQKELPKTVQLNLVERKILDKIAGTIDHQCVVGVAAPFVIRSKAFDPKKQPFIVMLDGIQDPRNMGAILRSAYCTNVSGIVICKKSGVDITGTVIKASAGLAEHMEVYQASTSLAAINELKNAGYNIYLAALGGENFKDVKYELPICVVIGNEGEGISRSLLSYGTPIQLAQKSPDISYNASVAAGIIMFTIASSKNLI